MTVRRMVRALLLGLLVATVVSALSRTAEAQENSTPAAQAGAESHSPSAELAKETREAAGEEEENENLKHSAMIQFLARKTGLTVHQAHMASVTVNFLIIAVLIYWFARKSVPAAMQSRKEAIRRALEEGRAASEDAKRRLGEIEARLSRLDAEITQMQAHAETEAAAEEASIRQAAEEEVKKVVQGAEQEIAAAAKQARRELSTHTADLAVALARKQIHVDNATDQSLVKTFIGTLSPGNSGKDRS